MKATLASAETMNRTAATRSQFLAETGFGFFGGQLVPARSFASPGTRCGAVQSCYLARNLCRDISRGAAGKAGRDVSRSLASRSSA